MCCGGSRCFRLAVDKYARIPTDFLLDIALDPELFASLYTYLPSDSP